jgi:hypothetical protein
MSFPVRVERIKPGSGALLVTLTFLGKPDRAGKAWLVVTIGIQDVAVPPA